jgi:hypothetical protein
LFQRPFQWEPSVDHADRLRELLVRSSSRPVDPDGHEVPEIVRKFDSTGTAAVIGYGSWYIEGLRKATSFADVYLVVDDYAHFHRNRFHAWMNRVLPPNVYFLWTGGEGHRSIRGKYNVISAADLERECGPALRDVYSAGRLSKLVWLAWARDEPTREWLVARLVDAQTTLAPLALGMLGEHFFLDDFSHELLALSYRGEPRLEGWDKVRALHEAHAERYVELHQVLLEAFAESTGLLDVEATRFHKREDPRWDDVARAARRILRRSRLRGYLRWPRIVLSESNLVDLAINEAERKAGVRIHVTPQLRRHPFLRGLPEFLRVLRERSNERIR